MADERSSDLTTLEAVLPPLGGAVPRTDAVVGWILAAIRAGSITNGEQLPNEIDLATQLGVAPMTLRKALAILRGRGLVETKRGRSGGSFLRASADTVNSLIQAHLLELTVEDLLDLGAEHCAITGAAASLAARRAVPAEVDRLRLLAQRLVGSDDPVCNRYTDRRFQIEVAVCSQSMRLTRAEVHLQAELSPLKWLPQLAVDVKVEAAGHLTLVDAIQAKDDEAARCLAENHSAATIRQLVELRMK